MKNFRLPRIFPPLRRALLATAALLLSTPLPAQTAAATGEITGRVQNEATGQYLNNARLTVKGTDLTAFTDETGMFHLAGVPAGTVTVEAFYSGLDPQTVTVNVTPGQPIARDIGLTNKALYGDKADVVKLDAFVFSSSKMREGESLATNEQRFAANIKNVVATDAYGDVIEGNVAEFMKNLPGITIEYSDVMPLAVSVRGFDPNLTNVTSDGATLANASRNGQSRQFDFMQVSINNISRIEVTKVPRPQDPASGISGSVNMVSKSAFERSRAQLNYRLFVSASSDGMMLRKQPFPFDTMDHRVDPGFDFDYTLPVTKDFGLVFTALHSRAWNEQNQSQTTWNATAAGTGATQAAPYLQTHGIFDAPKWYDRNSTGLKADWRVTPNSVLSVGLQATYYYDINGAVNRSTGVGTNATSAVAGGTPLTFGPTFSHSASGRGVASFGSNVFHIEARTLGSNVRWRYQSADWTIETSGHASTSKTWNRAASKGSVNIGTGLLNPTGVRVNFDDITPEGPKRVSAFDANNRPLDLRDIRNYALNTITDGVLRDHRDDTAGFESSAKRSLTVLGVPASVQLGGLFKSQDRSHRRPSKVYSYTPPDGDRSLAPFAMKVYTNRQNYFDYDYIQWPSPNGMVDAWRKNPSLFTQTLANQITTETNRINGAENFKENTTALYLQGEARFFHNKLLALAGVRFEKVHTKAAGPLYDPDAPFVRNADGSFARTATGARIRKPEAGAAGSLEELLLMRKELGKAVNGSFEGYYPSLHLTYNVTSNLLLRAAYAKTYGKGDFATVVPNTTIDENESYVAGNPSPGSFPGVLIVGNPSLKPWLADNFDLSAEYYSESGGVFSVGAYRKNISSFHDNITGVTATPALLEQLGLDPAYAGWEVRTTVNGGDARVDGMEFNVRQSLKPLGGLGRYFTISANATKLKLYGSRNASFTRFVPESFNYGFTFTRNPVTVMLKWNGRGEQRQGTAPVQGADAYLYQEKRTTTDLNVTWQFKRQLSLFANGRNIFNVHFDQLRYGPQTPAYAKTSGTWSYGVQWAFGIKGTF